MADRWKVLDSYGCELADLPTLAEAKEWCREGAGPFVGKRLPLVSVTNLGGGVYEVDAYTGRFTIQRTPPNGSRGGEG